MKAIKFKANMGALSIRERVPSFRLKSIFEANEQQLFNLSLLQEKELDVILEPVEGASEVIDFKGQPNKKSESKKTRDIIYVWWKTRKDMGKEDRDFDVFYKKSHKWIRNLISSKIDKLKGY